MDIQVIAEDFIGAIKEGYHAALHDLAMVKAAFAATKRELEATKAKVMELESNIEDLKKKIPAE